MFVKPADGTKVRDPQTKRHIPEAGAEVPESTYWLRRVKSGDVVVAKPASARAPAPAVETATDPQKSETSRSTSKRSSKE